MTWKRGSIRDPFFTDLDLREQREWVAKSLGHDRTKPETWPDDLIEELIAYRRKHGAKRFADRCEAIKVAAGHVTDT